MNHPEESARHGFAVSECSYPCPWCEATNDSLTAEFCNCVSVSPTLICHACGVCFCAAGVVWRARAVPEIAWRRFLARREALKQGRLNEYSQATRMARPIVLVVDDDKVVHVLAARVLEPLAGTILHAFDGEQAWSMAREVQPDLLITDAFLPKLDGRELSRRVKTNDATRHCRVLVMTALYKGLRYRSEAFREFLVDEYEHKPVPPARLRALAESLLRRAPIVGVSPRATVSVGAEP